MKIVIIVFLVLSFISLCAFIHAIKHAVEIDPKEPFIYGDYDPSKDPNNEVG